MDHGLVVKKRKLVKQAPGKGIATKEKPRRQREIQKRLVKKKTTLFFYPFNSSAALIDHC